MIPVISAPGFTTSVVILSTVIFYYIYFYFITSGSPEKFCAVIIQPARKKIVLFLLKKFSGFLILGLIPGVIYYFSLSRDFRKFGFSVDHFINNFLVIFPLVIIIAIILFINQKANKQNNSLQINLSDWNILLFLLNAAGWIIYLVGYEFLFRGILLFECYTSFGFWPAITINVTIYSALHMVNGKDQTIGALIFGAIACYFTLSWGSVLIPVIMHISLSILSDYFSIKYNTSLSFIKQINFNLPQK